MTLDLDKIEALDKARTQGPWLKMYGPIGAAVPPGTNETFKIVQLHEKHDWDFIAACSTAVPEMIAEIRRYHELEITLRDRIAMLYDEAEE